MVPGRTATRVLASGKQRSHRAEEFRNSQGPTGVLLLGRQLQRCLRASPNSHHPRSRWDHHGWPSVGLQRHDGLADRSHSHTVSGHRNGDGDPGWNGQQEPTPITSATGATSSACDGTDLSASGDFGAGAGNDGFLIKLTSISASPCELSGYLSLVDTEAIGPALHVSHGSSMLYSDPGPHSIVVAPGSSAYFGIGYAEAGGCADGGTPFHAINIVFASDVLTLPIGTWRMGDIPGFEEICDGDVAETAVSLSKELPPN